jgi:hypothetical protein
VPGSSRGCDEGAAIVLLMDVVAIALGLAIFLLLLWMVEGVDRI